MGTASHTDYGIVTILAQDVACLPTCMSAENPPKYEQVFAGDYLVKRFKEVQKYKTPAQLAEEAEAA